MRYLPLALILSSGVLAAEPEEPDREAVDAIFELFDHSRHLRAFRRADLGCPACHQVGATSDPRIGRDALDAVLLRAPAAACHYCHNPSEESPVAAPSRCTTCHVEAPTPASHGMGWRDLHGSEARLGTLDCRDCHRRDFCIECHERRNPTEFRVHDYTWITVHGIAARTNPMECTTCHLQVDCIACHATQETGP